MKRLFTLSSTRPAYPLGLELELTGHVGKEKYTSRSQMDSGSVSAEIKEMNDSLNSPLWFGGRVDARGLFVHTRALHFSAGAGTSLDYGRSSGSANSISVESSYQRFLLEPNARVLFFVDRSFALGLGLGYYFALSSTLESKATAGSQSQSKKFDLKEDGGFRLRLLSAFQLSGANRPQFTAGYQYSSGTFRPESSSAEKVDISGHEIVLSYVHPILPKKKFSSPADNEEESNGGDNRRRRSREEQKNPRRPRN